MYQKINSYTRVLNNGKKSINEIKQLINNQSISKSHDFEKASKNDVKTCNNYTKFCNKVFENRRFISQKDFHDLILLEFGSNCTWYRKRMIDLGLITEQNKLIKPI